MEKEKKKPYRICAAYDSETSNLGGLHGFQAFPILHQLGYCALDPDEFHTINQSNVREHVQLFTERTTSAAHEWFDALVVIGQSGGFVPIVMVHNLGFDMHGLSTYINSYASVQVLAKSSAKPISFKLQDDQGQDLIVFWDTLGFYGKSLEAMGTECKFPKLVGSWDYNLVRTPETPLTDEEMAYAEHDILVMWAYLGHFLRHNPLIDPTRLGINVVTKTGVVREKRKRLFQKLKGWNTKTDVGQFWRWLNIKNLPKSNDELFTLHAATRGGFTFCASRHASVPYMLDGTSLCVAGYDAVSQHPAQMCSHFYPHDFEEATIKALEQDACIIGALSMDYVLRNWARPFPVAFYACFSFDGLRPRPGSLFEHEGIYPLAWARTLDVDYMPNKDNQNGSDFMNFISSQGYMDVAEEETHAFGKLESAGHCVLFLTELEMWILHQVYEWDEMHALSGYDTMRFCRPSDMTVLSVMHFYKAKNVVKRVKEQYDRREELTITPEVEEFIPEGILEHLKAGTMADDELAAFYMGTKADLNALFGIEATNEAKTDSLLTAVGIEFDGIATIEDLPENPKAFYQMGQRIVGWSRIAQIVTMCLGYHHALGIINGDTDSVKFLVDEKSLPVLDESLSVLGESIANAIQDVTSRVRRNFPDKYADLRGMGTYEREFVSKRFCAAWNKSYLMQEYDKKYDELRFDFTLAGITTTHGEHSYNRLADWLYFHGWTFEDVCNVLLGYNVTIDDSITGQTGRKQPRWGEVFDGLVTDYQGNSAHVQEPAALALFAMPKTIGDTNSLDNSINARIAERNNPAVNVEQTIILWNDDTPQIVKLDI